MTSKLQALNVVVNRLFKDHLKQLYSEWLLTGDHALRQTKRIKKPSMTLYCQWIITSWQCSSSEVILKGFKRCCISDELDGTDNGMLWNDSEGDGNVKNKCEEDEVTAFEDGHSTMKIKKKSDTDLYRQKKCHMCKIYIYIYINCKIFFSGNFIRVLSWIWIYVFSLGRHVLFL
jgi:hypothetical protein